MDLHNAQPGQGMGGADGGGAGGGGAGGGGAGDELDRLRRSAGVLLAHLSTLVVTRGYRQAMALALLEEFAAARRLSVAEVLTLVPGASERALERVDWLLACAEEGGPSADWGERLVAGGGDVCEAGWPRRRWTCPEGGGLRG